jgi:hypothetical protein
MKPSEPTQANRCFLIRDIPPAVKKAFKAACAKRDEPMNSVLIRLMREYIDRANKVLVTSSSRDE